MGALGRGGQTNWSGLQAAIGQASLQMRIIRSFWANASFVFHNSERVCVCAPLAIGPRLDLSEELPSFLVDIFSWGLVGASRRCQFGKFLKLILKERIRKN